jgi:hypothetical protein
MRLAVTGLVLVLLATTSAYAVKITLFMNTPTYVERAKDIVIARCLSPAEVSDRPLHHGLDVWDVEVLQVLKGDLDEGRLRVASLFPLEPSKTYMLYSMGGLAYGSEFLAIPELSVIELPQRFNRAKLDGADLVAQVNTIFAARLDRVNRDLVQLQKEQKLLVQAVGSQAKP